MRGFGILPPGVRIVILQDLEVFMGNRDLALGSEFDHLERTFH